MAEVDVEELLRNAEWVQRLEQALVRPDDDEDPVQEVFSAASTRPPPAGRSGAGWLAGVTRNRARLRWRARLRRERYEGQANLDDPVPTPEMLVERAEAHQLLTRVLLQLEEPFRSTLLLRFY